MARSAEANRRDWRDVPLTLALGEEGVNNTAAYLDLTDFSRFQEPVSAQNCQFLQTCPNWDEPDPQTHPPSNGYVIADKMT
jgi:hypothetical protein